MVNSGLMLAGRYRLEALIGRGGMGEVWQGFDLQLERPVAVKVLLAHVVAAPQMAQALVRFRREGKAAAKLSHPAIAGIYDIGEHEGHPFLVLELLQGEDLRAVLDRSPRGLPIGLVLDYAVQVTDGLAAAHAAGIVHRDITPANLMLLRGGKVKICDFGIARLEDATAGLSADGARIGTIKYMPPEQIEGKTIDQQADLYSLGCTVFHLVTGQVPFPGDDLRTVALRHLTVPPPSSRSLCSLVPADLDVLLLKLLAKDPAQRPSSAAAVAMELRAIAYRYRQALDSQILQLLSDAERMARACTPPYHQAEALRRIADVAAAWDPAEARRLLTDAAHVVYAISEPELQTHVMLKLAEALADSDPAEAQRLLKDAERIAPARRDLVDFELEIIAKALAEHDPDDAERIARALDDEYRIGALLGIAEVVATHDAIKARGLLLDAERIARTAASEEPSDSTLQEIAEAAAQINPDDAERIALTIAERRYRVSALEEIAEVVAKRDPAKARQLLTSAEHIAQSLADPSLDAARLRKAAEALADRDPVESRKLLGEAECIARTIGNRNDRATEMHRIAKILIAWDPAEARRLLDEAERIALTFGRGSIEHSRLLALITESMAELDPSDAERIAHTIDDLRYQLPALQKVAQVVAEWDPAGARQLLAEAERIASVATHPMLILDIFDDDEQKEMNEDFQADALRAIAEAVAVRDTRDAERIAYTIPGAWRQARALQEIAKVVAERDPGDAERVARTIRYAWFQANALLDVAEAVAAQYPRGSAL